MLPRASGLVLVLTIGGERGRRSPPPRHPDESQDPEPRTVASVTLGPDFRQDDGGGVFLRTQEPRVTSCDVPDPGLLRSQENGAFSNEGGTR